MNPARFLLRVASLAFPLLDSKNAFVAASGAGDELVEALVSWMKAEKGFMHRSIEIRRYDPNDTDSRYGVFASSDIDQHAVLLEIPRSIVLSDGKPTPSGKVLECDTVKALVKEFQLGNSSKYAPYVNYLLQTQSPGNLPATWSEAGKELFLKLIKHQKDKDSGKNLQEALPPIDPVVDAWHTDCNGSDDPMEKFAAELVTQRAWDNLLIPVYDMVSHRNGFWFNTEVRGVHGTGMIQVFARRKIRAGEEIYGSYNLCEDCRFRHRNYGTPDILRDYGFLEGYPRRWIFPKYGLAFEVEEKYHKGQATGNLFLREWILKPTDDNIAMLNDRMQELTADVDTLMSEYDPSVPKREWDLIYDFANAMLKSAQVAIDTHNKHSCPQGNCHILSGYKNLDQEVPIFTEESYTPLTCDNYDEIMEGLEEEPYEEIEVIKTHYQELTFFWNKDTKAACFDIEGTVQICDDYRPHYHEMSVHYAARYLDDIKRVLFVGGGDSMLLHEVLKYPSLEFVVGLEIDQKVVRYSFKHFGTQPHFDDEKVQWWFGDAAKSLLMLPKEYFGSFDLVLVDLSETITANSVTEKLDILGALALLVKPEGIILKNEVYFQNFASMFKYSVMASWYDNPIICSQVMSMASNTVDFLNPTFKDHGVKTLFLPQLEFIDPIEFYRDYAKNTTSHPVCYESEDTEDAAQVSSPGILLILETENAAIDLADADALKHIFTAALEQEGVMIISSDVTASTNNRAFVSIILNEGYVVARTDPEHNYCGFDIHFWGSFDKQEGVKKALISAVKSENKDSSSFRIIAGGMFGVKTWKDDKKRLGPSTTEGCDTSDDTPVYKAKQSSIITTLGEVMTLVDNSAMKVAVLCGPDITACENNSNELLEKENIDQIVHLGCPMMKDFNEYAEDAKKVMHSCRDHLFKTIKESADAGKFNALVIDSSATKFIASVFLRVFASDYYLGDQYYFIFEEDEFVMMSVMSDSSEDWRMNFMKAFKDETFYYEPATYAEVALQGSADEDDFKLLIISENEDFFEELKTVMGFLEKKSGLKTDIQLLNGGQFIMQNDFSPSHPYSPADYDHTLGLQQWKSQQPIGLQVVSQMEGENKLSISKEKLHSALDRALSVLSAPTKISSEKETRIQVFDGFGDGCIFVATWAEGTAILLWDGRSHVDVNLFANDGLEKQAKEFQKWFKRGTGLFETLYDEHPRGYGKVVSYKHDFEPDTEPHWI